MKRAKYLFDKISELDNLYLAFYKSKKGKATSVEMQDFQKNLGINLEKMATDIQNQNFAVGNYTYFTIKDPKERQICAASFRERVFHHAIMNVCHHSFEDFQIFHSYATRPDKGTHTALQYAVSCQQSKGWFIKLDVKKFFDTINHNQLKQFLAKRFKEPQLLHLFTIIIDSYNNQSGIGLPIGNLTSQYFANFYMAQLDHYAKETLQIKKYVRYMDDIVFWCATKELLISNFIKLKIYLNHNLKQDFKPEIINKTTYCFSFLGYIIAENGLKPNKRSNIRYQTKIRNVASKLEQQQIDELKASQIFWSLHSFYTFNVNTHQPKTRTVSCVAAVGTTTPRTVVRPSATTTTPRTTTTTTVFG